MIILYIILILLALLFLISYKSCTYLLKCKKRSIPQAYSLLNASAFSEEYICNVRKENFKFLNNRGDLLFGDFWYYKDNNTLLVILCHGFRWNRVASYKYAKIFMDLGFDVLLYDHRHSGKSEGKYTTMAYLETDDLRQIVDSLKNKYTVIGTHGESMGASTVLRNLALHGNVDFAIADCPYAKLLDQFKYRVKCMKLHFFPIAKLSSMFCKLLAGFSYKEIDLENDFINSENKNIPTLLVHGKNDKYVPHTASIKIYLAKKYNVEFYLNDSIKHAGSFEFDKVAYFKHVKAFLEKYSLL